MKTRKSIIRTGATLAILGLAIGSLPSLAQVPVDDEGYVIGDGSSQLGDEGVPLRSASELEELVGPVALYPDDLLAIVLPAATYPLQIVEAARFLTDLESNPELEPSEDWDDSIVALVNYPEVVEMLNDDLDWTWQLGEAVVAQQGDVIQAIASFRDRAYAAGNLKSDEHQTVVQNGEVIEISPVSEEVIYVPYYEPERVVVYQPRPVYYYYPRAYPVYYYPYPYYHSFSRGYFWGVTTAFTIGWNAHCLNVFHPTYYGHPYYGYSYYNNWWYRNPSVTVYNNIYYDQRQVHNRYSQGDRWRSQGYTRLHHGDQRITRNRYYPNPATADGGTAEGRAVSSGQRAARGNNPELQSNRVQRSNATPRQHDGVREIRQALVESRAATNRAVRVPRTQESPGNRQTRETGVRVHEVRDALAASREERTVPAQRGAATAARPNVTTARPAVPAAREALPAERPTNRTWNGNTARQTTQVAPARQAPQRTSAPVVRQAPAPARTSTPSHRSPPADSRAAPSRPAPSASTPSRDTSSATPARARTSRTR